MRVLVRLVAASVFVLLLSACGPASTPPNLFVVVFDTTRADRLTPYGYDRDTTPHLEAFTKQAILFKNTWSTSSWTVPAHASLFTGLLPMTHQATQESPWLADDFETLAELLSDAGWQTAALSNNTWVGSQTNLLQGFDEIGEMWRYGEPEGALRTQRALRKWLRQRDPTQPFFVFVNLIDPHWRYLAPKAFQSRFLPRSVSESERRRANFRTINWYIDPDSIPQHLIEIRSDLYDAEVAWTDEVFGRLLRVLEDERVADDTLVVVMSDHGEMLGDHGHPGHAFSLYEGVVSALLSIRVPDSEATGGSVRRDPVLLTDVFTTLAAAAGVRPQSDFVYGYDLLDGEVPADRVRVAEYYRPEQYLSYFPEEALKSGVTKRFERRIRAIRVGDDKLVWGSDGRHELFDLEADPKEDHNRSAEAPETVAALEKSLDAILAHHRNTRPPQRAPDRTPDPAEEERLRELGYIQ